MPLRKSVVGLIQSQQHALHNPCHLQKTKLAFSPTILVGVLMSFIPMSQKWKSNRAVLFVHGIGNSVPKDYQSMLLQMQQTLGLEAGKLAYYALSYDSFNDWFAQKAQIASALTQALKTSFLGAGIAENLGQAISEYGMDVLWPIFVKDAREIIQTWYTLQLQQMVQDGIKAGIQPPDQKITIICHSLGCLHTYEILHRIAKSTKDKLQPATDGVVIENVIFMASPTQMIRSVAQKLSALIPNGLACMQGDHLSAPYEDSPLYGKVYNVKNWISITGELDPVGGYFFREKMDWAYMQVGAVNPFTGQQSNIDKQLWLDPKTVKEWLDILAESVAQKSLNAPLRDPHSWAKYIEGHSDLLKTCLLGAGHV